MLYPTNLTYAESVLKWYYDDDDEDDDDDDDVSLEMCSSSKVQCCGIYSRGWFLKTSHNSRLFYVS
jgi:hypothetical protein